MTTNRPDAEGRMRTAILHVQPADVRPGDIADHVSGSLDPREVSRVDAHNIWLRLDGGDFGPCPKLNYTFIRRTVTA